MKFILNFFKKKNVAVAIVLELPYWTREKIVKLNSLIPSEVDYSNNEITPHIPLALWYVSLNNLPAISEILSDFSIKYSNLQLKTAGFSAIKTGYWNWNTVKVGYNQDLENLVSELQDKMKLYFKSGWKFKYFVNDLTKSWFKEFQVDSYQNYYSADIPLWFGRLTLWKMDSVKLSKRSFSPKNISIFTVWNFCVCKKRLIKHKLKTP